MKSNIFFLLQQSSSIVQLPRSGLPTLITTSSTVRLQARRWVVTFSSLNPSPPLLYPLFLQVELFLITTLPGQINGCILLSPSGTSRQQTPCHTFTMIECQLWSYFEDFTRIHWEEVSIILTSIRTFLIYTLVKNNSKTEADMQSAKLILWLCLCIGVCTCLCMNRNTDSFCFTDKVVTLN